MCADMNGKCEKKFQHLMAFKFESPTHQILKAVMDFQTTIKYNSF